MDDSIEIGINQFQYLVFKHFDFLLKIGFERTDIKRKYFEYPQDKEVEINYLSETLCVSISWYLIYQNIEVSLMELKNKIMFEKYSVYGDEGCGKTISLFDLSTYSTNGKIKRPLPEILPGDTTKTINKKIRQCETLIRTNFDGVIGEFAVLLKEYGKTILKGDFSIFPMVQSYSRDKLDK
jgi:hypothetical protein